MNFFFRSLAIPCNTTYVCILPLTLLLPAKDWEDLSKFDAISQSKILLGMIKFSCSRMFNVI